nr:hypothetical protein [Chondromyces apiculatus]
MIESCVTNAFDTLRVDRIRQHDPGIVHDDVHAPELLGDLCGDPLDGLPIGHVDLPRGRLTTGLPEGIAERIEPVLPAREQCHAHPAGGERLRRRLTNTARCSRDDNDSSRERASSSMRAAW